MYTPDTYDGGSLERYLQQELQKISDVLIPFLDGQIDVRDTAPTRPRNGMYYADGTNWNPGSGRGVYRYDESTSAYVFLG